MKILVVYATRAGSTAEVAQAIGQELCAAGAEAVVHEVGRAEHVADLATFESVVLGSAMRYGAWLPEMTQFIETHAAELARWRARCCSPCRLRDWAPRCSPPSRPTWRSHWRCWASCCAFRQRCVSSAADSRHLLRCT
jgi:flavodoxin